MIGLLPIGLLAGIYVAVLALGLNAARQLKRSTIKY